MSNNLMVTSDAMTKIVALCKRRGFIFPGSEIYGGIGGLYDYGPLGTELKNNIKREWWKSMVYDRDDVVGIDAAIIMNPKVWEASGHVEAFTDPLVECKHCHARFRADWIEELQGYSLKHSGLENIWFNRYIDFYRSIHGLKNEKNEYRKADDAFNEFKETHKVRCPVCNKSSDYTQPKRFNLLTEIYLGVTEPKQETYLRGEITQGVFVNFKNIVDSTRVTLPFGIAQIGKAFRNEITPGNFTYRTREFEQMELEFFIKDDDKEAKKWFTYWKEQRMQWYTSLGMKKDNLRFREHAPDERAHYARAAEDIEYKAPFGWSEFEGVHHRGDWDLSRHKLTYKDEETDKEYTPWVIETSGGVDRSALFFLINAYHEDKDRVVLKLHPKLAPYKVAVFPLLANKPELTKMAEKIYQSLKPHFMTIWDDRGNIGKRYYSQDEIGTPWCVTVDFQSLEDETVTVRDRDTTKQERMKIKQLSHYFKKHLD